MALMIRAKDVHQELGIPLSQVYILFYRGDLPAVRIGREWFVRPKDYDRFKKSYLTGSK